MLGPHGSARQSDSFHVLRRDLTPIDTAAAHLPHQILYRIVHIAISERYPASR